MEKPKSEDPNRYEEELRNLQDNIKDLSISDESLEQWCFELYKDFHETIGTEYKEFEKSWPKIMDAIRKERPNLFEKMKDSTLWYSYARKNWIDPGI